MIILTRNFIDAEVTNKMALEGQFRLVVRSADGDIKRDTGWFSNLILDSGLNRWGTGNVSGGIAIGTGTTAPNASQTGLIAQSAFTTTTITGSTGNSGASPYYGIETVGYRFALGALNGNYSEVGIGWATGANMFSRALIVDGVGNPTTITVTSSEQLDVYYTLRAYAPTVDTSTTVTIGGVSTTVLGRASLVSANGWGTGMNSAKIGISDTTLFIVYTGAIGAATGSPSGTSEFQPYGTSYNANNAYVNNSLTNSIVFTLGLNYGNLAGGIGACRVRPCSSSGYSPFFQYQFTPAIAKTNTKTLSLTFSQSWARRP